VFGADAVSIGQIVAGGAPLEIGGLPLRVDSVLPASGCFSAWTQACVGLHRLAIALLGEG